MYIANLIGTPVRVTATGYVKITPTGKPANLIGFLCCNSATATGGVQLFVAQGTASGSTSGATAISSVIVFATGSVAQFVAYPAYCSSGFDINVGAAQNPDITLFWNPA